jgi:GNAT superfamily N-acetyltransferase
MFEPQDTIIRTELAGGYFTSDEKAAMDIDALHRWFTEESAWARGRTRETVIRTIRHALAIGLYAPDGSQAGFARAVTDYTLNARLTDVVVLPAHRGKGLATGLVRAVLEHPSVATVKAWTLSTDDAHGLYAKFGFTAPRQPEGEMEWRRPRPPAIV